MAFISQLRRLRQCGKVSCSGTRHTDAAVDLTTDLCIQKPTSYPRDQNPYVLAFVDYTSIEKNKVCYGVMLLFRIYICVCVYVAHP